MGRACSHTDGDTLLQETGGATPDTLTLGFGQRSGSTDRFFHQDWLGSGRSVTDLNGATLFLTGKRATDATLAFLTPEAQPATRATD